jgi:L-aspartate oxidase
VLVLGAGLAGMRAAWAAKEADPRLRVTLVSPRETPSGSSFANRNNALGLQAPREDEAEAFVAEVLRLAPPGTVLPELVRALAQDAPARLADLLALGLDFRCGPDGALTRFPGCFSTAPRAVIFDNLASAHAAFCAKARGLGVTVLHGFEALALRKDRDGRVGGALLCALRGNGALELRARAVVAALGGPAPLFARRMCGPGGSGLGYGLLASAGATLVNARFLQFFWLRARSRAFVNPGELPWQDGKNDAEASSTLTPQGDVLQARPQPAEPGLFLPGPLCPNDPERLSALLAARRTHCPLSHGRPDAALDHALLARRDADGLVRLPGQEPLALYAHAGNGGARIDAQGRTDVPGLYACGECAGGMHGADRIGGGMVLSALVFGARAGAAAAEAAGDGKCVEDADERRTEAAACAADRAGDAAFLRRLRNGMEHNALPGLTPLPRFTAWLKEAASASASARRRLLALSALAVLGEDI